MQVVGGYAIYSGGRAGNSGMPGEYGVVLPTIGCLMLAISSQRSRSLQRRPGGTVDFALSLDLNDYMRWE